jgi:hypothetical protein
MKKILVLLALTCLAISAYAQRDIPAGGCMEVASVENNATFGDAIGLGKQISLYKVKDDEGNPSFFLCVSNVAASFIFGSEDDFTSFTIPSGGVMLDFGTTYDDAMDNLDALLDMFKEGDGAQKEFPTRDGGTVNCTFNKGLLGKQILIAETSLSRSDVKSLKTSLKISKKLHRDL